jgi:hypothetical protein
MNRRLARMFRVQECPLGVAVIQPRSGQCLICHQMQSSLADRPNVACARSFRHDVIVGQFWLRRWLSYPVERPGRAVSLRHPCARHCTAPHPISGASGPGWAPIQPFALGGGQLVPHPLPNHLTLKLSEGRKNVEGQPALLQPVLNDCVTHAMTIKTTRRFCARPAGVLLVPTGSCFP